jgi:cytochrome b561
MAQIGHLHLAVLMFRRRLESWLMQYHKQIDPSAFYVCNLTLPTAKPTWVIARNSGVKAYGGSQELSDRQPRNVLLQLGE